MLKKKREKRLFFLVEKEVIVKRWWYSGTTDGVHIYFWKVCVAVVFLFSSSCYAVAVVLTETFFLLDFNYPCVVVLVVSRKVCCCVYICNIVPLNLFGRTTILPVCCNQKIESYYHLLLLHLVHKQPLFCRLLFSVPFNNFCSYSLLLYYSFVSPPIACIIDHKFNAYVCMSNILFFVRFVTLFQPTHKIVIPF